MKNQQQAALKMILEHLASSVPKSENSFDESTGRFLASNGGWAVTRQDIIFPLALLFKTPGTEYYQNSKILDLALRGGDALRNWQDADGKFEFIKTDGSRWGKIYMPWSMYHWLETFVLLQDVMDVSHRNNWQQGLFLTFDGVLSDLTPAQRIHNIPAWHAMTLVRAGQLFNNEIWFETGKSYLLRVADAQNPEGYWAEGSGPTTLYNLVYQHSLGLYYHFTKDKSVLDCLKRALDFHIHFTYPDGTMVETVDGRVKYRKTINITGSPGFAIFPEGRSFVQFLLRHQFQNSPANSIIPKLASLWQHFPNEEFAEIPQDKQDHLSVFHNKALVRKKGSWFLCFSGYLTPKEKRAENANKRFVMDRQNYFGLFHNKTKLIIGGGNSKHQPEFGTFEYWEDGKISFEADKVTFETSNNANFLRADFNEATLELKAEVLNENCVKISFQNLTEVPENVLIRARFQMRLKSGTKLSFSDGSEPKTIDPLAAVEKSWDESATKRIITAENWRLEMPVNSTFEWPVYPFNPYAIDGAAPPENAIASVSVELNTANVPLEFTLTIS